MCIPEDNGCDKNHVPEKSRMTTRQSVGIVNRKDLYTWCMKGDGTQTHPDRDLFLKICEDKIWKKFKASVMSV